MTILLEERVSRGCLIVQATFLAASTPQGEMVWLVEGRCAGELHNETVPLSHERTGTSQGVRFEALQLDVHGHPREARCYLEVASGKEQGANRKEHKHGQSMQ